MHQLHAHLLTALPSLAKIESTRFRSAAFANTTEELPAENEEKEAQRSANRARERTRAWREEEERKGVKDDGEAVLDAKKTFMTPEEKKRVAFIKKDVSTLPSNMSSHQAQVLTRSLYFQFHASADFTNAYIVFAHPHPDRSANVAPLMDPYEAARMAATRVNGTVFNGRTIRVDLVRASASTAETARAKSQLWIAGTDPKKSVFVGNLGLEEKEEGVREFFEKLLTTERGEVPEAVEGEEAYAGDRWVVNVRIIRDKGTGLGKGFAYVATRVSPPSSFLPFVRDLTSSSSFLSGPRLRRRDPRPLGGEAQVQQAKASGPAMQDTSQQAQDGPCRRRRRCLVLDHASLVHQARLVNAQRRSLAQRQPSPRRADQGSVEGRPKGGQGRRRRSTRPTNGQEEGAGHDGQAGRTGEQARERQARVVWGQEREGQDGPQGQEEPNAVGARGDQQEQEEGVSGLYCLSCGFRSSTMQGV